MHSYSHANYMHNQNILRTGGSSSPLAFVVPSNVLLCVTGEDSPCVHGPRQISSGDEGLSASVTPEATMFGWIFGIVGTV